MSEFSLGSPCRVNYQRASTATKPSGADRSFVDELAKDAVCQAATFLYWQKSCTGALVLRQHVSAQFFACHVYYQAQVWR